MKLEDIWLYIWAILHYLGIRGFEPKYNEYEASLWDAGISTAHMSKDNFIEEDFLQYSSGIIAANSTRYSKMSSKIDLSDSFEMDLYVKNHNPTLKDFFDLLHFTIQEIEAIRGNPVLLYFGLTIDMIYNERYPINATITKNDARDLENIIKRSQLLSSSDTVDFILNTGGGLVDFTADIVFLLRKYFKRVNILVPNRCSSAGTLLTCSADEIVVLKMSFFSMTNPVFNGVDSYSLKRVNILAHLFCWAIDKSYRKDFRFNPYAQGKKAEEAMTKILQFFLQKYNMKNQCDENISSVIRKLTIYGEPWKNTWPIYSHSASIHWSDLQDEGLNMIEAQGELQRLMRQINVLNIKIFNDMDISKLFMDRQNHSVIFSKYTH